MKDMKNLARSQSAVKLWLDSDSQPTTQGNIVNGASVVVNTHEEHSSAAHTTGAPSGGVSGGGDTTVQGPSGAPTGTPVGMDTVALVAVMGTAPDDVDEESPRSSSSSGDGGHYAEDGVHAGGSGRG